MCSFLMQAAVVEHIAKERPWAAILDAVVRDALVGRLVEEVVGCVRHKRRITNVC